MLWGKQVTPTPARTRADRRTHRPRRRHHPEVIGPRGVGIVANGREQGYWHARAQQQMQMARVHSRNKDAERVARQIREHKKRLVGVISPVKNELSRPGPPLAHAACATQHRSKP